MGLISWAKWALGKYPEFRRRGRFRGNPILTWLAPRRYWFDSTAGERFSFERGSDEFEFQSTGELILPDSMETDGGSIPKAFWHIVDPWEYMPAYIIHDWEFESHHRGVSKKSFDDVNITLLEAVYTMMADELVDRSSWSIRKIWDGVSSPIGRRIWDR